MANSFISFFLPLLFILTTTKLLAKDVVESIPDLTFISAVCGIECAVADANSFRKSQARRVTDGAIGLVAPGTDGTCSVTDEQATGTPPMYSRVTCSGSVSMDDCTACIRYAQDQLLNYNICHDKYGAEITVASCFVKYDINKIAECPSFGRNLR